MIGSWVLGGTLLSLSLLIWRTVGLLGLVVLIVMSLAVGWIAIRVQDRPPRCGHLAGMIVGLLGGWTAVWILDQSYGPHVWGIAILPAILGVVNARLLLEVVLDRVFARAERPDTN